MPLIIAIIVLLVWAWFALGYHIVWKPTEDQLYGCTIEQQAPNGECK
jgi:hypothetical protein